MTEYTAIELIRTKRDRGELPADGIRWLIEAYTRGDVGDEQMAALAMAIYLNGMTRGETLALTRAMLDSGERLDVASLGRPSVDKHSTGGVGDKITLPLMPLVASFGVVVPQLSGRGLGHTGGTLDKLESIPGWRGALSNDEMLAQLRAIGGVVCGAGPGLAPADRKLYALRDTTGTVESIPLIASSIMSKKLAEGTDALVLDVKVGSGAFMKSLDTARELAETLVDVGEGAGVRTSAILTDMATPLGLTIGNANEVREAVEVLEGRGPDDVVTLTCTLASEMLALAGIPGADVNGALESGRALEVWRRTVRAQGGDPDAPLPEPRHCVEVRADRAGFVERQDAYRFGLAAWRLGAGRARKEDAVAHAAGIDLAVKPGARVDRGDVLFTLHADDESRFEAALAALDGAYSIGEDAPEPTPLILGRVRR